MRTLMGRINWEGIGWTVLILGGVALCGAWAMCWLRDALR